jgi:hypothetical protein
MSLGFVQASGGEPDLKDVCTNSSDSVTLRNVIYTLWALNKGANGSRGGSEAAASASCYLVCQIV